MFKGKKASGSRRIYFQHAKPFKFDPNFICGLRSRTVGLMEHRRVQISRAYRSGRSHAPKVPQWLHPNRRGSMLSVAVEWHSKLVLKITICKRELRHHTRLERTTRAVQGTNALRFWYGEKQKRTGRSEMSVL